MKRILYLLILFFSFGVTIHAQGVARFGFINVDSLLKTLPEYNEVDHQMKQLSEKYQAETAYNEQTFRRQYAEFLQGQKQFTPNILAKRQAELQQSLEKNLAFRCQADSLLNVTREQLIFPIRQRLQHAINAVGIERGYEYILDTSLRVLPFVNVNVGEDVTSYVLEKYGRKAL